MEDRRTIRDIMNQVKGIEKNNLNNTSYVASIDLLLTSENNGTVKDAVVSKKFEDLKEKMEEINGLTREFISVLSYEDKTGDKAH